MVCECIDGCGAGARGSAAGADVIVAQGSEAGGHRGCFRAADAERTLVGLVALVPAIADAVRVPVVATGGIADGRGVAAALALEQVWRRSGQGFCDVRRRIFRALWPMPSDEPRLRARWL